MTFGRREIGDPREPRDLTGMYPQGTKERTNTDDGLASSLNLRVLHKTMQYTLQKHPFIFFLATLRTNLRPLILSLLSQTNSDPPLIERTDLTKRYQTRIIYRKSDCFAQATLIVLVHDTNKKITAMIACIWSPFYKLIQSRKKLREPRNDWVQSWKTRDGSGAPKDGIMQIRVEVNFETLLCWRKQIGDQKLEFLWSDHDHEMNGLFVGTESGVGEVWDERAVNGKSRVNLR
ncbi:hypothetical protein L596_007130 [Steinernema carpocapsae]|uniref:Uncharacterized protein n=1 Tax=Steinernema carpocapsae TaxID=34508 RepID=A0A4V6A5X2_STECR|nr:hypothetical protein L596_007130 [Steinernema carpocapsae]